MKGWPSKNGDKENLMQLINKTKKRTLCQFVNARFFVAGVCYSKQDS
jgi:hypothetical protein